MANLEKLLELASKLPENVRANAVALVTKMGEKIEGIGDSAVEWRPENLRVFQPTSDRSKAPKGTNIGSILISDTIVEAPIKTIPLRIWDSRQYWSPDKDEAKVLCSSPDGKLGYIGKFCKECEFGKFNPEANKSACNNAKTAICITADLSRVFVVNFTKTNYANGKDWMALMRKAGVAPYKRVYELKTETNKKYKNVESLVVNTENEVTNSAYVDFLEALFQKIGGDRDEHLKRFYELVQTRQQNQNLLENNSTDVDGVEVLPAPTETTTEAQSSLAKKYQL